MQLSQDQNELWLEKLENKQVQLIRLMRHELDWGSWMQRDMELTATKGDRIRQQFAKRQLNILNIYISTYPPVDDYEFRIAKPTMEPRKKKTAVSTIIFDRSNVAYSQNKLNKLLNSSFSISLKEVYEEEEVLAVKQLTFTEAKTRAKSESQLFQHGKPFFTYVFIAVQVFVFFILELNGGSTNTSTLLRFGAKFNPFIIEGEWWRFFTPIVLHIGFLHLFMNTLALFYLGTAVERIFGNVRFLFIYVLAGFFGSLASFVFSPSISAGASGAIFGCFGALLYFGVTYPRLFFRTMGMNILIVIGINLVFGFTVPGIDNAGHLGGLLGGFLATGIVHFPKKRKLGLQAILLVITIGIVLSLLQYGYAENTRAVDGTATLIIAQEYIKAEKFDETYKLLQDYLDKEDSPSLEIYVSLAFVEMRKGMYDEAKEHLLFVINQREDYPEAHYYLAIIYLEKQDIEAAIAHADRALELSPNDKAYRDLLAHIDQYLKEIGEGGLPHL